ncbi:MAG: NusG domain II-containing protein [Clostridia bacterium]|nr:NusG domain II-containing protein [Clostridia bacterium]
MSLKKIEQVKNSKWFRIWDLVVYGVIIVVAVALILAFTLGRDKSQLSGFSVSFRNQTLLTYEFGNDKSPSVLNGEYIEVKKEDNGNYTVRFTNGDGGYNVIYVDVAARTVDVTDSNCSSHKDCVHTAKLTNNSSLPIICTVHGLTVSPLKFEDNGNIII